MTASQKKQYLNSYLLQQTKIKRLQTLIAETDFIKDTYIKEMAECQKTQSSIEGKISRIENEKIRELLYQKYICGKTLEEISYILNYSKRHVERLHRIALDTFVM